MERNSRACSMRPRNPSLMFRIIFFLAKFLSISFGLSTQFRLFRVKFQLVTVSVYSKRVVRLKRNECVFFYAERCTRFRHIFRFKHVIFLGPTEIIRLFGMRFVFSSQELSDVYLKPRIENRTSRGNSSRFPWTCYKVSCKFTSL